MAGARGPDSYCQSHVVSSRPHAKPCRPSADRACGRISCHAAVCHALLAVRRALSAVCHALPAVRCPLRPYVMPCLPCWPYGVHFDDHYMAGARGPPSFFPCRPLLTPPAGRTPGPAAVPCRPRCTQNRGELLTAGGFKNCSHVIAAPCAVSMLSDNP